MAKYDKYEPYANGERHPLAADWPRADAVAGVPYGVGLNASGQIVKGAGQTGIIGLLILNQSAQLSTAKWKAGDIVDVMSKGDVIDWITSAGVLGVAAFQYYVTAATGLIIAGTGTGGATQPSGSVPLGYTAQVSTKTGARFICRYAKIPASA